MDWTTQRHAGERLIDFGAPALLAAASGWAAWAVSGVALAGVGAAVAAMVAGVAAMRRAGAPEAGPSLPDYAVESIDVATSDELLLDDPLAEVAADSRVVSMFEREADEDEAEAETPGAMVARIVDYLGERRPVARATEDESEDRLPADAGAALHEALANIRASLR